MRVTVNRKNIKFSPDASGVTQGFPSTGDERATNIIRLVSCMSENYASRVLSSVLRDFSLRHRNISKIISKSV